MKLFCPECRSTFDDSETICPNDGTRLYRLDPADDPLVGATLDDRYRIDWLIGEGGMGAVYRGVQLSVNREIAIKVLRAELNDREVALERFFREAKLVSELSHPNIVRVVDFGQDHDRDLLFLVMELVRGVSLGDLLEQGRLRVNFALELAYQVCGALTEPHAAGIVHRDLKPDNLLLVPVSDGTIQVKVLDFGIARALERNTRLTATGMICGTPAYMAPEQSRNLELDPRTDLYALGVLLYEMLAGLPPFSGQSSLQIMLKHIQEKPQRLRDILPPSALPEEVEGLVHDMMSKDRDERPQSAHEVRQRIEALRSQFDLDPVRVNADLEEEEMFEEWLLPSLPTAAEATRSETQALRRETGLFDHLDGSSEAEVVEAETLGMHQESEHRSGELDEVNLNDTEVDQLAPTTPGEIPVFEGEVRHAATSPGPASAWTPGPRQLVPVEERSSGSAPAPEPAASSHRSSTSEMNSAGDSPIQPSDSPRSDRPRTDRRPEVEDDSRKVSTTATVLMSVAGSAVIMALFTVAGVLYYESTTTTPAEQVNTEDPAAEEPTEEPVDDKPALDEIDENPALSSAIDDSEQATESGIAEESDQEGSGGANQPAEQSDESPPKEPTVNNQLGRGSTPPESGEQSEEDQKTSEAHDEGGNESVQSDDTQPEEPRSKTAEKSPTKDEPEPENTEHSGSESEALEVLENTFESGSLRSE